jgi:hypothetical protein
MNIRPEIVVLLLAVIAGLFLAFKARETYTNDGSRNNGAPYIDWTGTGQVIWSPPTLTQTPASAPASAPAFAPATAVARCYQANADGSTTTIPCPDRPVTCYQANADGTTTAFPCPGSASPATASPATTSPAAVTVIQPPPVVMTPQYVNSNSSNLLSSQFVNNLPTQECVLKRARTSQLLNAQGQMQEIITGYDEYRSSAPECQVCPEGQARVGGVCRSNFDYNYNDQGILGVFKGRDNPFTQIVEDDYTGPGLVTPGSLVNFTYGGITNTSGIVYPVTPTTVTKSTPTTITKSTPTTVTTQANVCGVPQGIFARKEASGTCVSKIDPDDAEKGDIKKFLDLAVKDVDATIMDNAVLAEIVMLRTPTNRRTYHFIFISEADAKNAAVFGNFDVSKPATPLYNKAVYEKYVVVHVTVDNGNPLAPKVTQVVTPKNEALPTASKCPAGQTRVGSVCTPAQQTKPDPRCKAGSGKVQMRNGVCACPPGQTDKDGTCVWTASGIQPTRCVVSTAGKKFPYYRPRRGQACVPCNPKNGCKAKVM